MGTAHTTPVQREHSLRRAYGSKQLGDTMAHYLLTTTGAVNCRGAMVGTVLKPMILPMGAGRILAGQSNRPSRGPIDRTAAAMAFGPWCALMKTSHHLALYWRPHLMVGSSPRHPLCSQRVPRQDGVRGCPYHSRPSSGR